MEQPEQPSHTASQSPSSLDIHIIPRKHVDVIWAIVFDKIKKALDRTDGEVTPHKILNELHNSTMHLWVTDDAGLCAVTQINTYDNGKKYLCYVIVSSDELDKYRHFEEVVNEWGKEHGCIGSELYGRVGWMKVLKDYKPVHVLMRKDYED